MTAKEYLQRYLDTEREINMKLDEIKKLRELSTKTTQAFLPEETQSTEALVAKIVDMERQVDADVDRLVKIKAEIEQLIASIADHRYREVLYLRYVGGKRWEKIAVSLNYDYRYALKLHRNALQEIGIRTRNDI